MPLVVIEVVGGGSAIHGQLARRLTEFSAGIYVGSVSKRTLEILWIEVGKSVPKHATLVYPAKNELGCDFKVLGDSRYKVVYNYGVPLVEFAEKKIGASANRS